MAKSRLPIKEFLHLTNSERGAIIANQIEMLRVHFPQQDEWITACLNSIPKNEQEKLFICYMFGTFVGSIATRREFLN